MVLWWPGAFRSQPWRSWFWAKRPGDSGSGLDFTEWATGYYWFYKIPSENGHLEQLAFKSPEDRRSLSHGRRLVKATAVYILTYQNDTPNWGTNSTLVAIGPPCGNWHSNLYETHEVTRSQTFGILAAVRAERQKIAKVRAAVAKTGELECTVQAAVMAQLDLPIEMHVAVMGERERALFMRAAVRTERLLESTVEAAVGKDFSLPSIMEATVQGNVHLHHGMRVAVRGETQKFVGITAFVVKSRADHIYLEFENLLPQEMDLRGVPNWPSRVKDYRKDAIS